MIDITNEQLISLAEAAEMLPCGRKGRYPNVKTVYAWTINNGCRGVVLESLKCAGRRITSTQSVERFLQALTAASGTPRPVNGRRTSTVRDAEMAAELDRLGVR
ncbi:MAG: DUF1580 domain-containing protein [Planctomycetia bacterium]|nr:DUF1580 domain-containing protein [Planctomycetia bacterium]